MVQVQQEETAKDLIQAVTGVYGLCCSHLVHIQKKKKKNLLLLTLFHLCCAVISFCPPYLSSPLASLSLTFIIAQFKFHFFSSERYPSNTSVLCLWMLIYIFSNSLSPLSLLFSLLLFHPLFPPLSHPPLLSPFSSKLIALKHSLLLTSTPLCPPQSHIT